MLSLKSSFLAILALGLVLSSRTFAAEPKSKAITCGGFFKFFPDKHYNPTEIPAYLKIGGIFKTHWKQGMGTAQKTKDCPDNCYSFSAEFSVGSQSVVYSGKTRMHGGKLIADIQGLVSDGEGGSSQEPCQPSMEKP